MRTLETIGLLVLVAGLALTATPAGAATIVIQNNDGAGEGFNDPSAPLPAMDCPAGMTLGQCRLNAFTAAANQWGATLESDVQIVIGAQFNPMACSGTTAVLGSAGSSTILRDFPGAPYPGTWYHSALADALAGYDVNAGVTDITAQFNSDLDSNPACTLNWWYGTDGNFPGNFAVNPDPNATHFYAVLLHEMAHGLGFSNFINEETGQQQGGYPDVYCRFTLDATTNLHWNEMPNAQRVASAINTGNVVLDSPENRVKADNFVTPFRSNLVVNTGAAAGTYNGYGALFGAPYTRTDGVTLDMELTNDGAGASTSDGCEPLVGFTAGRIAWIDRGTCQFGLKALHAEQAGAAGVVIADNQVSTDPFNMAAGEFGRQVKIPIQYITQANANTIRPTLPVNVTFDVIAARGLHANGFVQLYTPNPVQLGSSISHYDELLGEHVSQTMGPNPLMGPAISLDLYNDPDMALGLYRDEGWTVVPVFADGFNSGSTWGWNFAVP